MKVGIFGGTFNPVHYGHLRAAEEVREKLGFDKILFIPSGSPPLKTANLAGTRHRYEMVRLALGNNPFFEPSDIECRLSGKSYTVKTIRALKKADSRSEFFFILGIDAFLDIPNWWHPKELIALTDFVIISRPCLSFAGLGTSPYMKVGRKILKEMDDEKREKYEFKVESNRTAILFRVTPICISSTEVRRLVKQGKSIKYLLPPDVQSYIISKKLYRS